MVGNWKVCGAFAAFALLGVVVADSQAAAQVSTQLSCKGCVNARQLGKKAVTTAKIKNGAVQEGKIRNGAVSAKKIQNGAVTSAKIAAGAVEPGNLADDAQPAGIASASGDQDIALTGAHTVYRTVTLNAPADGNAVVNASWVIAGLNITSRCSITTGTSVETDHTIEQDEVAGNLVNLSGSAVRAFPVTTGANTFNLVCYAAVGSPNIRDSSLVALYVPGSY